MNIDIQKLRSAIMVAKNLSISEAAFNLSFSPSAVSKHIKSLEEEMGVVLFERHSRSGVSLTKDGRMLLPVIQKTVTDLDELEGIIRSISESPDFWLGTAPIFPNRIASAFISQLVQRVPDINIQILHHNNPTLIELVRLGRLDAGISTILGKPKYNPEFMSIRDKNLVVMPVFEEREVVLLNKEHPLSLKEDFTINELLMDKNNVFLFINPNPNIQSPRQKIFDLECKRRGIKCASKIINLEIDLATETLKRQIAMHSNYVAFMPPTKSMPSEVVAKHCIDNIFTSRIVIYYMKNNRSRGLKAFIEGAEAIFEKGVID